MSVLVTGGAGYIGSQLIRDLPLSRDFKGRTIRILDNMFRERYVSIMNLPAGVKYEFIEGDIRKDEDLKAAFKDVEVVFDLAGITNAPLSFERKELTMDVNYEGWKKILTYAIKNDVKFVYASSASVYGSTEGLVDEDYDCKPASPYGESKLMAEHECIKACKESGLNATVLRLGTVYGYTIGMRFDTVVDRFVYFACIGMPLTVWIGAENAKRPYLHVKDCVRGLMFAATDERMKGEVYNLVGQNASLGEIIEIIRKQVPNVKIDKVAVKHLHSLSYMLDNSKIRKLGFETRCTLEEGVKEIVEKFKTLLQQ